MISTDLTDGESGRPHIDPFLFEEQFKAFCAFVRQRSRTPFVSFASNSYTDQQEGYKYRIHRMAREKLRVQNWRKSDIGTGKIAAATIKAIEIPGNNLVVWQARWGEHSRQHQPLYDAKRDRRARKNIEACLYQLYQMSVDETTFETLTSIFGRRYALIAYLFFVKDRSTYMPIASTRFDRAFKNLGVTFSTKLQCSWENYSTYLGILGELKAMLIEALAAEVTLLDAHSFAWILVSQMEKAGKLADVREYLDLPATERDALTKARIGQGRFRQQLTRFWTRCAVTGCDEISLLHAAHIRPWSGATNSERLSVYNGLLLTPALHTCFDAGLISFDDDGKIIISPRLSGENAKALGVHPAMRLSRVESEHKPYLAFHRKNCLKGEK